MSEALSVFTFYLDRNVREELRRLAKRMRVSSTKVVCDAVAEKVKQLKEKFTEEDELREAEKARKKRLDPLAPAPLEVQRPVTREEPRADRLNPIYAEHARRIAGALRDPHERRLRTAEAIAAIKRAAPLTHPSDFEIATRLEDEILALPSLGDATRPANAPPMPAADIIEQRLAHIADRALGAVERTIDPSLVKTSGESE